MRKHSIRSEANRYLSNQDGSYREKKYQSYVILKMINDLFSVSKVPQHWKGIDATHLQLLVRHWHQQKIKPSTMMNYMTIIRNFLSSVGNCATDIDNQSLGIIDIIPSCKRINISLEKWLIISDPIAQLLLNLQMHFGLTFREAAHLIPDVHIKANKLWLTGEMTFNGHERVIPIRSDVQDNIINEFNLITQNQYTLADLYGYRELCGAWNKALKALRIPIKKSCRYLYAQLMSKHLATSYDYDEVTKILMNEMGLKSQISVWNYLRNE